MYVYVHVFFPVESAQRNSGQEIPKINEDLLVKERRLEEIVSGELGLNRLWTNLTEVNKEVSGYGGSRNLPINYIPHLYCRDPGILLEKMF